ncbi:hypothetical protein GXM_09854 [Nostoc sphaeroides CCNUC1]|uniref:Uncharacterized protein n=1 Tax=Nostoc sphaeroides CCNUC1 TaxID=2653204 RepID=A0A5P8WIE0_9NOSO|nr:hypothetical protein GXM_09854 [Nostoc sphaeroides CCNUC1]
MQSLSSKKLELGSDRLKVKKCCYYIRKPLIDNLWLAERSLTALIFMPG